MVGSITTETGGKVIEDGGVNNLKPPVRNGTWITNCVPIFHSRRRRRAHTIAGGNPTKGFHRSASMTEIEQSSSSKGGGLNDSHRWSWLQAKRRSSYDGGSFVGLEGAADGREVVAKKASTADDTSPPSTPPLEEMEGVDADGKIPPSASMPTLQTTGIIPSETSTEVGSSSPPSSSAVSSSTVITTPTVTAAAAAAARRKHVRSLSMVEGYNRTHSSGSFWTLGRGESFMSSSTTGPSHALSINKGGSSSSSGGDDVPSLSTIKANDRLSRRGSFSRSRKSLSRRMSLDELVVNEDYLYIGNDAAPRLPPRLLPMISNGMTRLAINMKEAVMTDKTWQICLSLLEPEDAKNVTRYRFDKDKRLALGSRLLQRAVIHWTFSVPYSTIIIQRTEKGKPFFQIPPNVVTPFENWNYNVSHHGDFVGIVSEPVCLVGLDIMNAKEKPRANKAPHEFFRSFHRQLSASEWGSIYEAPNDDGKLERFYKQWALKEAFIKAIGSGLTFSPRRIEITGLDHSERPNSEAPYDPSTLRIDGFKRPDWRFKFSTLDNGHVACVSRGPPKDAIADYRKTLKVQDLPNSPLKYGLESIQPEFDYVSLGELIPFNRLEEFDASVALYDSPVFAEEP